MSSGNLPPSFSSPGDARALGGQYNETWPTHEIQADGNVYAPPPSHGSMSHHQGQSYNQFQDRGLGQIPMIVDKTKAPSFTEFSPGHGSSHNHDGNISRESGNSSDGQPLSIGAMAKGSVSQNSGGMDHYGDEKAPNLSDVNRRGSSQTAPDTVFEDADAQEFVGMSLVGKNFRKFYPNAYYKEKDGDNN